MSDINKVILIGRLTKDPELKSTSGGTNFCKFTLASNKDFGSGENRKETVGFYDCIVWGKSAEAAAKYFQKGKRIGVDGSLSFSSWQNQEGKKQSKVEINVDRFQFLDSNDGAKKTNEPMSEEETFGKEYPPMSDDEIPF